MNFPDVDVVAVEEILVPAPRDRNASRSRDFRQPAGKVDGRPKHITPNGDRWPEGDSTVDQRNVVCARESRYQLESGGDRSVERVDHEQHLIANQFDDTTLVALNHIE